MKDLCMKLWREEEGQVMTEYVLFLAMISLTSVAAMNHLATQISHIFAYVAAHLSGTHAIANGMPTAKNISNVM